MPTAESIIEALRLRPHPEGGHYAETWRADAPGDERPAGTAIYFLLRAGERSHWHRVDAAEVWHFYAGEPLTLSIADASGAADPEKHLVGPDLAAGQRPQVVVPAGAWQSAESAAAWSLLGYTDSPGFEYAGFELADRDWEPGG